VTTGDDIDSDGYTLMIDASQSGSIGANATRSLPGFVVGPYLVELSGVAANCTVSGSNPRTENITKDATTTTRFDVSCQAVPNPAPASITVVSGDGQNGRTNSALANALIVKVTDGSGAALGGETVAWAITSGGGQLLNSASPTNIDGEAAAFLETGAALEAVTVTATVTGLPPVTFTALVTRWGIKIQDIAFVTSDGTDDITVAVGDTIEWYNVDAVGHTVTSTTVPAGGSAMASGNFNLGETYQFIPDVAGQWVYRCDVHPALMNGATITAQ
jgi:plastocyanin